MTRPDTAAMPLPFTAPVDALPRGPRIAVIGDIGGQLAVFEKVLTELGVDPSTRVLPPGLVVVQVGDVVRLGDLPGLDSVGCIQLALAMQDANPGRWVQLLGNHEAGLLGGHRHRPGANPGEDVSIALLRDWWARGTLQLAVAVPGRAGGDILITHGGLVYDRWRHLGSPATATEAAAAINRDVARPVAGFVTGGANTGHAPPPQGIDVFTALGHELAAPWLEHGTAPFDQVHGHAASWFWGAGAFWPLTTDRARECTTIDHDTRIVTLTLPDGHRFTCVDWTLQDLPVTTTWPLLVL